jgi:hypothetical protein
LQGIVQHPEIDRWARTPAFFDRPSFREATRLISMELTPTAYGAPEDRTPHDDPAYMPIAFEGHAFSSTMPIATMKGIVRRTRDGVVRWSWVGAVCSSRGAHGSG